MKRPTKKWKQNFNKPLDFSFIVIFEVKTNLNANFLKPVFIADWQCSSNKFQIWSEQFLRMIVEQMKLKMSANQFIFN